MMNDFFLGEDGFCFNIYRGRFMSSFDGTIVEYKREERFTFNTQVADVCILHEIILEIC